MPENQKIANKKISKEWQDFLIKTFSANGMQFGLAAYLSTFGDYAEVGWNRIFSHFKEHILQNLDNHEVFNNISEDLQATLEEAGVFEEKQMIENELKKFENKFKPNIVQMAKKLHEFREKQTFEMIKKLLGDD